ncbi:MAG: diaminopimelate epimerase [Myxococcales bacterium]|nr:diaminopimelate epimerase [Myxococcales bacterium]
MLRSFAKLHGLGNDFLVTDLRNVGDASWFDDASSITALCDRHRGIGADGVLGVFPASPSAAMAGAQARMRVRNADGSEAEMCGNGLRCVASWLHVHGAAASLAIETGAGILRCEVTDQGRSVEIEMGPPRPLQTAANGSGDQVFVPDRCRETPLSIDGRTLPLYLVSMGNPHAVWFVDDVQPPTDRELWQLAERLGPHVEKHPLFPQRTNVEFVRHDAADTFTALVWERGCGITQACGTGACAIAVAACIRGLVQTGHRVRVNLPGGPLDLFVESGYRHVRMRGPVAYVFDGKLRGPI